MGYANQPNPKAVVISVRPTPATSGKQMYVNYCAPCHGVDGRGSGPVAAALKKQPTDLALLSKNNRGKFPSFRIMSVLQFGAESPSHGTAEMPVWGPMLGKLDSTSPESNITVLRINNLTQYVQSLQAK
jgi:hypothetical protein